jgi:alpha-beta hydrolase superfamily lysophospholipase
VSPALVPRRFGSQHRELFGAYHAPDHQTRAGALLFGPFGQEAIRSHRLFKVLADRLARAGVATLRFDHFGSGDSGGSDEEVDLDGWQRDALMAHAELIQAAPGTPAIWFGMRLGATVAALAAGKAHPAPVRLVLWDPVIDGEAYLELLRHRHRVAIEAGFGAGWEEVVEALGPEAPTDRGEALGFALPARFATDVAAITPDRFRLPTGVPTVIIASALARSQVDGLVGENCTLVQAETDIEWTSNEAMNTALVPNEILRLLVKQADELR